MPNKHHKVYKYFAFISYSRKDSKAAKWLQKRLEWFRFPVKRVDESFRPGHPRYIRPVYRDKTSLEVDHVHYWDNIKGAISQSRYLIVLCSPDAAASGPVDKEIRHFLSNPDREDALESVVPVILKGNVGSKDDTECLCPALLKQGSRITDRNLPSMVPDGDEAEKERWENGFTGVVSFLLRLKRETISDHCQKEERRRARRSRILSGVFALLAMLAVAGGMVAWQQRGKAIKAEIRAVEQKNNAVFHLSRAHIDRARAAGQNGDLLLAAQAAMDAYAVSDHPASRMAVWEYLQTLPREQEAFYTRGTHRGTLCLLSDGTLITSGGKEIAAWDSSGKKLNAWPFQGADVVGMAGGSDGDVWVLTQDGRMVVCRRNGRLDNVADLNKKCTSLALTGSRLALGTADGDIYMGNIGTGVVKGLHRLPQTETLTKTLYVALSHEDDILFLSHNAPGAQGLVAALDMESGKYLWKLSADHPTRLTLSGDSRFLAWYTLAGDILVVDSNTGRLVQKTQTGGTLMGWMGFTPDSRELTYACQIPNRDDSVVDIMDIATGDIHRLYEGTGTLATAMSASKNRLLASGFNHGTWVDISPFRRHILTHDIIWRIRKADSGMSLMCAGRPNWLDPLAGEINQRLPLRTLEVAREMWPLIRMSGSIVRVDSQLNSIPVNLGGTVTCSDLLPDESVVTGNAKGDLYHMVNGKHRVLKQFNTPLRYLHAGPDGLLVCGFKEIGKGDGVLRLTESGQVQRLYSLTDSPGSITASAFVPGTRQVVISQGAWAVSTGDSDLLVLDPDTGAVVSEVRLNASGVVRDMALVSGGRQVAAALASGEVALFSLPDLEMKKRFPICPEPVFRLADIPGRPELLAAGDGKGSVHIVDLELGESLYHTDALGAPVTAMKLTKDAWWIAFDNRLEKWKHVMDPDSIQAYAGQVRYHSVADLRQEAVTAEAKGKFDKALALWHRLSRHLPRGVNPLKQILLIHRKQGHYDAAVSTIDRIVTTIRTQSPKMAEQMNLTAFDIQKGQILYDKWQQTTDQGALDASLEIFLDALLQMPAEPAIHLSLLAIMLDDGHTRAGVRAAQALLALLSRQAENRGTLVLDVVKAGILCAAHSGISASDFQQMLPNAMAMADIDMLRPVLETWLGKTDGSGIDWIALPPREQAKLHFLLALRQIGAGEIQEARAHFKAGLGQGGWHGMNQRGLDELNGKAIVHHVPEHSMALYRFILDYHGAVTKEAADARYMALDKLAGRWDSAMPMPSGPVRSLHLKGLAQLQQAAWEIAAVLGKTAQAIRHVQAAADIWQELSELTDAPADHAAAAAAFGNLCWMELLHADGETALKHCRQGVSHLTEDRPHIARMNLAHACLLTGRFEEAAAIYQRYADTFFSNNNSWKDEIQRDFTALQQHNRGHPDMEKIENILAK